MTISQTLATAVSGLNANALRVQTAATNIVNQNTPGFTAGRVATSSVVTGGTFANGGSRGGGVSAEVFGLGPVDLATEFTRLIAAETAYKAAAGVIRTSEAIERAALDIVG